jgi:hypothetical protein
VTNKWAKLHFACRFQTGKEQVLRSCSVDAITVVMAVLRELSRPKAKLFEVAGFFSGISRRGSSGLSVKIQTKGLRDEFARLVVGALKIFSTSTESHWINMVGSWSHIADGFPEYADWDAAEVLNVLESCKHLTPAQVQQCLKASYPEDKELTLGEDMLDAQDAIQKEAAAKNSLRSSRKDAEEVRAQAATQRYKTAVRKGFHGIDPETGEARTHMEQDIVSRIHVTGRWELDGDMAQTR